MIVFDLQCPNHHIFEGWFGSSDDFTDQSARGLISCPICGADDISKAVMAPSIGAKSNQKSDIDLTPAPIKEDAVESVENAKPNDAVQLSAPTGASEPSMTEMKAMLSKLAEAQEKALESSRWVGEDFTDTARAMHYGEAEVAPVHGEASLDDAKELLEEGINIAPLPLPIRRPDKEN